MTEEQKPAESKGVVAKTGDAAKKVVHGAWDVTKNIGNTIAEHPVAGTIGALGGFVVGGPLGALAGAAGVPQIAKAIKDDKKPDEAKKD